MAGGHDKHKVDGAGYDIYRRVRGHVVVNNTGVRMLMCMIMFAARPTCVVGTSGRGADLSSRGLDRAAPSVGSAGRAARV